MKPAFNSSMAILLLGSLLAACAPAPVQNELGTVVAATLQALTPPPQTDEVVIAYENVSLVVPTFYGGRVTSEEMPLRDQTGPADAVPRYPRITLVDYPDNGPRSLVMVYAVADLTQAYPPAQAEIDQLRGLLAAKDKPLPGRLPFWPLLTFSGVSATDPKPMGQQVLWARAQFLDFKTGQGLRYVTVFQQSPGPFHMSDLIYTFQGLTADGKYYVSVVLPIGLRDDSAGNRELSSEVWDLARQAAPDYGKIAQDLDALTPQQYSLSLPELDALAASISVTP